MGVPRLHRLSRAARSAVCARTLPGIAVAAVAVTALTMALPSRSALAPAVVHADSSFDSALLSLLNQDRASHGLAPLRSSSAVAPLAESAPYGGCGYTVDGRAEDMIQRNYMGHTIPNCGSQNVFNMLRAAGIPFTAAAENLGYTSGVDDPNQAAQWINQEFMNSSVHAGNILNPNYTMVGVGSWHTAPGQTWSGAGSTMNDVLVTSVVFVNSPSSAPPPAPAPTTAPRTTTTATARPRPSSAPVRRPAMPEVGVLPAPAEAVVLAVPTPAATAASTGDGTAEHPQRDQLDARPVGASVPLAAAPAASSPAQRLRLAAGGVTVLLLVLGSLRGPLRLVPRRRRSR